MKLPLLTLEVRLEPDVVLARQRARQISALLGFAPLDQTRIATAVSEIARKAFQFAGGGRIEFLVESDAPADFLVRIRERGTGIRDFRAVVHGKYDPDPPSGLALGILGAKRLVDHCDVASSDDGATVTLSKRLPKRHASLSRTDVARLSAELARSAPQGLLEELQVQNQELIRALQELRDQQGDLAEMHRRELEETNRGVVALYSELDQTTIELKRISDLKTRFLSNMSHEFRSPLNTILSMSAFLLDGSSGELTAEQLKEIAFIRKAAEGLASLVNDLLDLAKVEAGKAVIRPESFEIADLFETLAGTTRSLLSQRKVTLVVVPPEGIGTMRTDEGKVAQILRNFLSNAAKFTEAGEIRLTAQAAPGDTVLFSVSDTGIGISPEDQKRIFEEFSQVEGPFQKRVKGTGLGLPLSKRLAELLGGGISVRSELGAGSTFIAALPRVYDPSEAAEGAPDESPERPSVRPPILVVEDDPVDLLLYEKILIGAGFRVVAAKTLGEARRSLRRSRPLAVLLDVVLDLESGWTLLEEMQRDAATKDIPVLVVTMLDGRERALALGASDFCLKPSDTDWLLPRLKALESRGRIHKILIVDDEEADRYRLKNLLAAQGQFVTTEAGGGEEGLRRAHEDHPDLIFLDLVMADMTGFEVLERLKSDEATRPIPVIINTATDLDVEERRRLTNGTAAILSKTAAPPEETFDAIRNALLQAGLNLPPLGAET